MKISDLVSKSLEAWADFGYIPGFKVKLAYLGRDELNKIKEKSTIKEYNPSVRGMVDTIDEDAFIEHFAKAVVLDWKGLKVKHLAKLIISQEVEEGDETVVDYSVENVVTLLKHAPMFDEWINEVTSSIESFRSRTEKIDDRGTEKVSKG